MPAYTALSIVAPGGQRIATGLKTIEVRSWLPDLALPLRNLLIVENRVYLRQEGESDPDGWTVALADVVATEPWRPDQAAAACSQNWQPGYYAWHLTHVRRIARPARVLAARGLYPITLQYAPETL